MWSVKVQYWRGVRRPVGSSIMLGTLPANHSMVWEVADTVGGLHELGVLETIKFFSVRTETNRNSIFFGYFLVCFAKPINIFWVCFGLFRCFGPVSKQLKQTEFSRNKPEESPKNILY
jgi:hypothetical protein